jgi:4,5-DOPA dioxygenase extradiol
MPVLFVGHGSPMNALEDNAWSRAFRALARELPQPSGWLVVSAHWHVPGVLLTANERPPTIHDFGDFPRELHEIEYPAPGSPALARRAAELLGSEAELVHDFGLDHGAWSVLRWLRPAADLPVVQLSLDVRRATEQHLELGRRLAPLAAEGVLVLASGNLVHNLSDAFGRLSRGELTTPDWAERFDRAVALALERRDHAALASLPASADGRRAHLLAAGAAEGRASVSFPIEGFDLGSLSMRAVLFDRAVRE